MVKAFNSTRVVVTGLGVVAPNGIGIEPFWKTLVAGQSGISRITHFDSSGLKSQIAGEVKGFDPHDYVGRELKVKRRPRHTQFALAATAMALKDAGIVPSEYEGSTSIPIVFGIASSSLEMVAEGANLITRKGIRYASPLIIAESSPNSVVGAVSEFLNVRTRCRTLSTGCAAGADAIGEAAELVRSGKADFAIAGGTECPISMLPMANFDNAGMASRRNDVPERASRPFDKTRDSGVISEGCGVVVIENLEHALGRGARPYLEILGSDLHSDLDRDAPGVGLEFSMRTALANAALLPSDIEYICAWGPGHPVMDRVETEMIKRVFGKHAYSLAVSSIKGVIGNPLSAAGPIMLISCCLMFRHNLIPPTANYEEPDPECDLDYVPNVARPFKVQYALQNAHGIGGANSSLVLTRVEI